MVLFKEWLCYIEEDILQICNSKVVQIKLSFFNWIKVFLSCSNEFFLFKIHVCCLNCSTPFSQFFLSNENCCVKVFSNNRSSCSFFNLSVYPFFYMSFLLFWQTFRKLMSHSELKLKRKKCWTFTWATIGRLWCLIMSHSCLRWLVSFLLVNRKRLNLQFFIEEKIEKHWKNYLYLRHNRNEAGTTFDNSFFDNCFIFLRQLKNGSFLGVIFLPVTGRSKN
jgi:hypothetical protein